MLFNAAVAASADDDGLVGEGVDSCSDASISTTFITIKTNSMVFSSEQMCVLSRQLQLLVAVGDEWSMLTGAWNGQVHEAGTEAVHDVVEHGVRQLRQVLVR